MRTYIGIDPGAKGFIAVMGEQTRFFPLEKALYRDIAAFLGYVKEKSSPCFCCMEEVHAVFGSSARSTFEFGRINGALEGILCALGIPYQFVQPKVWQKAVWTNPDIVTCEKERVTRGGRRLVRAVDTKRTSLRAAARLFPGVDLRKTPRCARPDDNKCDALLICEYGRRKNL